ncbi:MAG: LCP family protein [Oscillospiraceae bacterium]|nr:LCP family protein [Oscillospiraceae bacterium]MDD4367621.1 LCP family protein [Oscillospiraceae bacterium]
MSRLKNNLNSREPVSGHDRSSKPRRRGNKHPIIATLVILLAVILILAGVAAIYANSLLDKINYVNENDTTETYASATVDENGNILSSETEADIDSSVYESLDPDEASQVAQDAADAANDDTPLLSADGVTNILLIGTDNRVAGEYTRSDAMILLSINQNSKRLVMSSLMRDMYVSITGYGNTKLNHANQYGGPSLLLETVRNNFKVDVDQYAMVDFYSLADIIDIVGGIDLDIENGEIPYLNSYLSELNAYKGVATDQDYIQTAGLQHVNGAQAVAYARIRYYGNADFQRTERQRTVLNKMMEAVKGASILQLNTILDAILPEVETNLTKGEMLKLITLLPSALNYEQEQVQIPADGTFTYATINGLSFLVPDLEANREILQEAIYK